jgi:hypothetical protein
MKFFCYKCCDDIRLQPCILDVPKDAHETKKDILVGLTMCPFEGLNYNKGVWEKNGDTFKAEWGERRL